jgi:hypothetical protein
MSTPPKHIRRAEFFRRLNQAALAGSVAEALALISNILNDVEDEMTGIPYAPEKWQEDGRMYPPQADSIHPAADRPGFIRLRSRAHNTFIGEDGAIEIFDLEGNVVVSKPGALTFRRQP